MLVVAQYKVQNNKNSSYPCWSNLVVIAGLKCQVISAGIATMCPGVYMMV